MPQSRSRVIGRSFKPSRSQLRMKVSTWCRQCSLSFAAHLVSGFSNALSRKKKCFVSFGMGVVPWILHFGSFSSNGSRRLPQFSHWSPRARGKPQ